MAALAVVVLLVIAGGLVARRYLGTYHLATVDPGVLYRDGSRSVRELARGVEKVKAKTVVSLVDADESSDPRKPQFREESQYLAQHGVGYEPIPVKLGGWPSSADVQKFLTTVEDPSRRPVLLHCAQGVRRTAMFVAAYQQSVLGYDKARTKREILTFGHSSRTIGDIERFIDLYDPQTRTVSPELASKP